MADLGQALQEGMSGRWTGFGVSRPVARPRTGDEGGPTPYSEYSLHFKTTLVPRWDGRGQAMDGCLVTVGLVWLPGLVPRNKPAHPSLTSVFHASHASRSFCVRRWSLLRTEYWPREYQQRWMPSLLISAPAPAPAPPLIPKVSSRRVISRRITRNKV